GATRNTCRDASHQYRTLQGRTSADRNRQPRKDSRLPFFIWFALKHAAPDGIDSYAAEDVFSAAYVHPPPAKTEAAGWRILFTPLGVHVSGTRLAPWFCWKKNRGTLLPDCAILSCSKVSSTQRARKTGSAERTEP